MYRKLSDPARRSSPPKRVSYLKLELDDANYRGAGDEKRSLIPRRISRASSVERDDARRSSARLTSGSIRSRSVERGCGDNFGRSSDYRPSSVDNLCTPIYAAKIPVPSTSTRGSRTSRKDNRPLNDRGFQNLQLVSVQNYLANENIFTKSEAQEIRNPVTLKQFVNIMNGLFSKIFPNQSITVSNYCEVIPILMKKLKYPGNINRSWLVTANSPHSWPCVLGLMSWLTDILKNLSNTLEFEEEEGGDDFENMMWYKSDKISKYLEHTKKSYLDWFENLEEFNTPADQQFCDELLSDVVKPLEEEIIDNKKEIETLTNILNENDYFEESAAEHRLKELKARLGMKKSMVNNFEEKVVHLQEKLKKLENEAQTLKLTNENLKQNIDIASINACELDDLTELKSKITSLKNIIKLEDTHVADITSQCYAADIVIARLQGKIDEVRLQRDALLRECVSEYVDTSELNLTLNYANEDNSEVLKQFFDILKKKNELLENRKKGYDELIKNIKLQIEEEEEKLRSCTEEENQCKLESLTLKMTEMQQSYESLKRKLNCEKEDYIKKTGMLSVLEEDLKKENADVLNSEKQLMLMNQMIEEREAKYLRLLERIADLCKEFVKKYEVDIENMRKFYQDLE